MRRLISFILVLAFATAIGVMIRQDPGYALFAYKDWTMEMPLWLTLVLFTALLVICILVLGGFRFLFSSHSRVKGWWGRRRQQRSRLQLARGLLELTEGRFKKAEQYLSISAKFSEIPLIHYLSAAKAAEETGSFERRDKYLALAYDASEGSNLPVRLTEAQLRFHQGDLENARTILKELHEEYPKHAEILKLLASIYESNSDWHGLQSLLPELKKANIYNNPDDFNRLELKVYQHLLPVFSAQGNDELKKFWHHAPKSVQEDPIFMGSYCNCLLQHEERHEVEQFIRSTLKRHWYNNLVEIYGKLDVNSGKQLDFMEGFLTIHPEDPILYLTLGRLCVQESLWGKAEKYLKQSLTLNALPETYALLGKLMEQMGKFEQGQNYYKAGLIAATL
jgi:HemY protein